MFEDILAKEATDVKDDRNYSSLADEFDVAAAAEMGTTDELMHNDADDDVNSVRRRVPTYLGDNI